MDKDCNGFAVWSCFGYLHACDKCHAYAQLQELMDFGTEPYVRRNKEKYTTINRFMGGGGGFEQGGIRRK